MKIQIDPHTRKRMPVRGISEEEIEDVLRTGSPVPALQGRLAKEKVYTFDRTWQGRAFAQKKVRVVYVVEEEAFVTVTAIAYYGRWEA